MNYKDVLVGTFFGGAFTCFVMNTYIRNKYVLIPKKLN
jgi:hypothetical protein